MDNSSKTTIYVGLDVHKESIAVAYRRRAGARTVLLAPHDR